MSINKKQYTYHGFERAKERSNISDKELNNLSLYAVKNGINFNQIPPGPLKSYVGWKTAQGGKRVKLYRGYVFIFFLNSRRMITCYPLPEKHMEEYKKVVQIINRDKMKKKC